MIVRRLSIAGAAAALAVATLTAPGHAAPARSGTTVAAHASSASAGSAERRKRKWVLNYSISDFPAGGFDYTWRLTTIHGRPVRGVKVYTQYKPVPHKWSTESPSTNYVTDANGVFHVYACNDNFGLQRMYVRPTKHRRAVIRYYQLKQCGS